MACPAHPTGSTFCQLRSPSGSQAHVVCLVPCFRPRDLVRFAPSRNRGDNLRPFRCLVVDEAREMFRFTEREVELINALIGIQGRGRFASPLQLDEVEKAVKALESSEGVSDPTGSSLIEGRWQLMFTPRPGTASPIQRTFVGVDFFSVFQEINLRTDDPRVSNIVVFSDAVGELKVEAKGWLDTTFLSETGNVRISRGNKGTTFVLQKITEPRQMLLSAISAGKGVGEEVADDFDLVEGEWMMVWSSQIETDSWIENAVNGLMGTQVIRKNGHIKFVVDILLDLFRKSGNKTYDVVMGDAVMIGGAFGYSVEMEMKLKIEILYAGDKIRISRGYNCITFVHVCIDGGKSG